MKKKYRHIYFENNNWIVSTVPHVTTRLKRLFPQIYQNRTGDVEITCNIENSFELLWFMDRYPLDISKDNLRLLKEASKQYQELQHDIIEIMDHGKIEHVDFDLAVTPYDYQKLAANLLFKVKGYLLADSVGLGKTMSAICAMTNPKCIPALFVTLPHLQLQVEREINRFAPQLKTHIIKQTKHYKLHKKDEPAPHVIIISYSKLNAWADYLKGLIKYIVFDEVQEMRTGDKSLKYQAARLIANAAEFRLGLSATPIYNYGNEFFNIIELLRPNVLGTWHEFLREWCRNEKRIDDPKAFGAYMREQGLMLLRNRTDVNREIPDLMTIPHYINSDLHVFDKIKTHAMELAKIILSTSQAFQGQKLRATEEFNILMRQATGMAKAPYVAEFVNLLIESGESVVLYGWHREVYNIWMERLKEHQPLLYTGSESVKQKDDAKTAFIEGKSKVLIVSLRSGAGLDGLQYHPTCSTIVFGELDWSAGVHEQCEGRLARDGQTKKVLSYYLLSENGSDPVVADILGIKREQLECVLSTDGELVKKLEGDPNALRRLAQNYLDQH